MGLRGFGPGSTAVLLLLLITVLAAPAAANPWISVGEKMAAAPILLVIVNYPIDGVMLLIGYSFGMKRRLPPRPSGELAVFFDLAMAVLLFALIGSLIDLFTVYSAEDVVSVSIGLVGIALSCLLISRRYLHMDRWSSILTTLIVTVVNFVSWLMLFGQPAESFLANSYPIVVGFWLVFNLLLGRTAMKVNRLTLASMRNEGSNAMAAPAQDAEGHTAKPMLSSEDLLRTELVVISFVLLVLVLSAPIFSKPI
jgi:hypothetical protein